MHPCMHACIYAYNYSYGLSIKCSLFSSFLFLLARACGRSAFVYISLVQWFGKQFLLLLQQQLLLQQLPGDTLKTLHFFLKLFRGTRMCLRYMTFWRKTHLSFIKLHSKFEIVALKQSREI